LIIPENYTYRYASPAGRGIMTVIKNLIDFNKQQHFQKSAAVARSVVQVLGRVSKGNRPPSFSQNRT